MDIGFAVGPWDVSFDDFSYSITAAERHGFASYYLGDHFYVGEQLDSLEPYLLFALAARETERIRFGPLVTPVMFRPPSNVGRLAAQLDCSAEGVSSWDWGSAGARRSTAPTASTGRVWASASTGSMSTSR